jgi:ribose-phosphate pyrophosphokinase
MSITVNNMNVEGFTFPGGERHVNVEHIPEAVSYFVESKIRSSDDLIDTALVCDALYRTSPHIPIDLAIPYFPYARQDRVCTPGDPISSNVVTRIINSLPVRQCIVFDPHNPKAISPYLNGCRIIDNTKFIKKVIHHNQPDFLICPDYGALEKYQNIWGGMPTVICSKTRDPATGKLSGFKIERGHSLAGDGQTGLIVDDICDGGGTFLGIADLFPNNELLLAVSHGIFSRGLDILFEKFKYIMTTNSYFDGSRDSRVDVYSWEQWYD